jgi:hypothetical protein
VRGSDSGSVLIAALRLFCGPDRLRLDFFVVFRERLAQVGISTRRKMAGQDTYQLILYDCLHFLGQSVLCRLKMRYKYGLQVI